MADAEEQLAGTLAKGDGPCLHPTCETGQFLKGEPITKYKDGWMHVHHKSGWDDEGGRTKQPRKRAAKKSPAGGAPAGDVDAQAVSEPTSPPAGDPPLTLTVVAGNETPSVFGMVENLGRAMSQADADEWWEQTTPGLVVGMPNDVYHRDPWHDGSVSNSDAKLLLDAPALYRYHKDNPRTWGSRQMNLGSAAHTRVLGEGDELVKIPAAEYRTNESKRLRDEALAAGKIPLLGVRKYDDRPCEWDVVDEMAKVLEQDPLAPKLFAKGRAEVSAFWIDPETGVPRRCRFDWLPDPVPGQRLIVPDFKSTEKSVSPGSFSRSADDYGYDMQDFTYSSGLAALGVDVDAAFVFVVQSVKAPYLVAVHQLDDEARELGHQRTLRALRRYQYATETGDWFGYAGEVHDVSLPGWAYKAEEFDAGEDARRYLRNGWEWR